MNKIKTLNSQAEALRREIAGLTHEYNELNQKVEVFEEQQKLAQQKHSQSSMRVQYSSHIYSPCNLDFNYHSEMMLETHNLNELNEKIADLYKKINDINLKIKKKKSKLSNIDIELFSLQQKQPE